MKMTTEDFCRCWRTEWEYDVMTDGDGYCKHCNLPVAFFFMKKRRG